ncbi:hypothetical protein H257_05218 [Aphanomyces astaci]|uniref:DUF6818 domain-containing protein n=1 Tax=Aphanomyces astaci TaxID=112090 RepID=W4GUR5_APHAT|nr:hypothetical protein H257_05218 [Aphanomyces astaci]ETV82643.1 hypothetical protein H257_05218 [Aphanomyces astaci]|eukprot:XP_009828312.1 hypothetical protein H257_05218 [Aphanomyces astaci]
MTLSSQKKVSRGRGWTEPEVQSMLDVIEDQLPMGPAQWDAVQESYMRIQPADQGAPPRDVDSIRRKFKTLRSARKPTGDPLYPPAVSRAKRIQRAIEPFMGVRDLECPDELGIMDEGEAMDEAESDVETKESSTTTSVVATQRTGLTAAELAVLGKASGSEPILSHKAQRRHKIDDILAAIAENQEAKRRRSENNPWLELFVHCTNGETR